MLGYPLCLIFATDHETGNILQEQQRDFALLGQFDEMRALLRALAKQHAIIGKDRDRRPPDMGKAAHQRAAIKRLEFMKLAAIDEPRDYLMHIIGCADIFGDDAVEFLRIIFGRSWFAGFDFKSFVRTQMADDIAHNGQRMFVILGQMVDHT